MVIRAPTDHYSVRFAKGDTDTGHSGEYGNKRHLGT